MIHSVCHSNAFKHHDVETLIANSSTWQLNSECCFLDSSQMTALAVVILNQKYQLNSSICLRNECVEPGRVTAHSFSVTGDEIWSGVFMVVDFSKVPPLTSWFTDPLPKLTHSWFLIRWAGQPISASSEVLLLQAEETLTWDRRRERRSNTQMLKHWTRVWVI